MLNFDPTRHHYHWYGKRVPSVTQCLDRLFDFSQIPAATLERKRQIGIAVHAAIHMELTGCLDPASIDPVCKPWWDAWCRFRDDLKFEPVLVEFRVVNTELGPAYTYAGTLDEWGYLQGYPALVDWKCTFTLHTEAVGAQTAAYLKALVRMGFGSLQDRRFALKLGGDTRYKLEQFRRIDDDWARFVVHRRQWRHDTT